MKRFERSESCIELLFHRIECSNRAAPQTTCEINIQYSSPPYSIASCLTPELGLCAFLSTIIIEKEYGDNQKNGPPLYSPVSPRNIRAKVKEDQLETRETSSSSRINCTEIMAQTIQHTIAAQQRSANIELTPKPGRETTASHTLYPLLYSRNAKLSEFYGVIVL